MDKKEKYLLINAGSSSFKFALYEMPGDKEIVNGVFERIGDERSSYTLKYNNQKVSKNAPIKNHKEAAFTMIDELLNNNFIADVNEIASVGHRVLLGGEKYKEPTIIDEELMEYITELSELVPLHHPGQIAGIRAMQEVLPNVPMVAVFDNTFHRTMPAENYHYAIDERWLNKFGIRKYGFHGISYQYITETMQRYFNKRNVRLIVCHIGSGASVCCIRNGQSFDTTMGLTPLAGIVMGTRCGDVSADALHAMFMKEKKLQESLGVKVDGVALENKIYRQLNMESGLKGLSGNNDFRDIERLVKVGDYEAIRARKMFINSIIKYISYYYSQLHGSVDALVFTAGIGENSDSLRRDILNEISYTIPVELNDEENKIIGGRNEKKSGVISTADSLFPVMVIPTNEESIILRDTYELYHQYKIENPELFEENSKVLKK